MISSMKQIIENRYLKGYTFPSSKEAITFFNNQKAKNSLSIEDAFGDNHYCYVCYHSLTREKQFALYFGSDEIEEKLNFLFWNRSFVVDTGNNIYLLEENLNIKASFEITTPLVGFYLIDKENLLLLEKAYMRVINYKGEIVKNASFNLIEDFSIKGSLLSIQTSEESKVIELI